MRYCKIENGVITKYNQKRSSFGVGANSDEQTCIDKGYYILLGNPPSIDSATQRIGGSSYVIDEATKTVEKVYTVIDIPIEELIAKKIQEVKSSCTSTNPVEVLGVMYNGGDSSAGAISGAVQLAEALSETVVNLWDIDNVVREYSLAEALSISAQIGKAYRDEMLVRQAKIAEINACTTVAELDLVEV